MSYREFCGICDTTYICSKTGLIVKKCEFCKCWSYLISLNKNGACDSCIRKAKLIIG